MRLQTRGKTFPKTSTQSEYWNPIWGGVIWWLGIISKNIDSKWVLKRGMWQMAVCRGIISKNIDSKWVLKPGTTFPASLFYAISKNIDSKWVLKRTWRHYRNRTCRLFPKTSTQSEYWNSRTASASLRANRISKNIDSKWVLKQLRVQLTESGRAISKNIDSKWVLKHERINAAQKHVTISKNIDSKWVLKRKKSCNTCCTVGLISKNIDSKWVLKLRQQCQCLLNSFLFPKTSTQSEYWNLLKAY